jgi:NTP pyrophosphatase (non-canonical NTP hydrolase)
MTLDEYQVAAMKTRLPTADFDYALINLGSEVGEFMGLVAKFIRDKGSSPHEYEKNLHKELGDILWHVAALADSLEIPLSEIAQINLDKLASRKARGTLSGSGDDR